MHVTIKKQTTRMDDESTEEEDNNEPPFGAGMIYDYGSDEAESEEEEDEDAAGSDEAEIEEEEDEDAMLQMYQLIAKTKMMTLKATKRMKMIMTTFLLGQIVGAGQLVLPHDTTFAGTLLS
jgi:hypothetical protein